MNKIEIEIGGRSPNFDEVWVHLQDVTYQDSVPYRISVATTYVRQVFDPYATKESESSWADFIGRLVAEFGTLIIGGFIKKMGAIIGNHDLPYLWVIATVDEVVETEEGIELIGQAVRFVPYGWTKAIKLPK